MLRSIALGDQHYAYVLRFAKRKSIAIQIGAQGLNISAPPRTAIKEIEALIFRHQAWIQDKMGQWATRKDLASREIRDGVTFPFFGRQANLQLCTGRTKAVWNEFSDTVQLTLFSNNHDKLSSQLEAALKRRALEHFTPRVASLAATMGLPILPLTLTSAKGRWGSCSQRTGIRLHWKLIYFSLSVIDYIIIHELAHVREMNHSPRFWAIVEHYCPDYRTHQKTLKIEGAQCPHWVLPQVATD